MLNIDTSFQKAIENFPKWMDIRKRSNTSRGGKYLLSIIEELSDIQAAITDMKKSFFLANYDGKEDDVLAYVYTAQVGEDLNLSIDYDDLIITSDINKFYKNIDTTVLYQDGYLAVSENTAKQLNKKIEYCLDDRYKYSIEMNSYAVWNIFDEFGMFFGLERLENESNRELTNRCYLAFKNRTNCSEQGLKNTIKNALSNYETILDDEIEIMSPNEIDMLNTKINDISIYDSLAELNKDTYRFKKWNHDVWDHDFAHIKYLPHTWNWPLRSFQNGTGNNDDCKIVLGSEENIDTTDISIVGYKKSDILIDEYIRNNNVEQVIPVTLTKYNDVLKSNDTQFQITATEAQKIDLSDITIHQYESQEGINRYYISDIINYCSDNITEEKRNLLEANTEYRLKFAPTDNFSDMKISKCKLITNSETDLLIEKEAFKFDATGSIVNKDVLLHITNIQDFTEHTNMKNLIIEKEDGSICNGFTLGTESQIGKFTFHFDNPGNKSRNVVLDYSCKKNNITNNNIYVLRKGFELINSNTLRSEEIEGDNYIQINLNCNYLSFEIPKEDNSSEQGSFFWSATVNGKPYRLLDESGNPIKETLISHPQKLIVDNKNECLPVSIKITKSGREPLTVKNILSCAYKIEHSSGDGKFSFDNDTKQLKTETKESSLTVTVTSQSAYAPVFNYLHVGLALGLKQENNFTPTSIYTIDFKTEEAAKIDIDSTCSVSLYKILEGQELLVSSSFVTKSIYKNNSSSEGFIEIYLNDFTGEYKTIPEIQDGRLYLLAGQELDSIYVEGTTLKRVESYKLSKLIDTKDAQFYISNALNGIIRRDLITEEDSLISLSYDFLKIRTNHVRVNIGNNKNISVAFSMNQEGTQLKDATECKTKFFHVKIKNLNKVEYLAYNTISIFMPTIENIEMVNNFSPLLDENKLVVFQITSVSNKNVEVYFKKKRNDEFVYEDWTFGKNELGISAFSDTDFMNTEVYEIEVIAEKNKYIISQSILFQTDNIAEYVVTVPENMDIHYDMASYEESFYIEDDGFNKLKYANINGITEVIVNEKTIDDWDVLKDPGIIVWKTEKYAGQLATIRYRYNVPTYMYYTDINDLYKIIGYSLSAYEVMNRIPVIYFGLKDGDSVTVSFNGEKADRIIVSCSNYQFISQITDNERITVYHLDYQDKIGIHNGFLYQNGLEYWLFANKYLDTHDNYNGVILDNVKRYGEQFMFSQTATNFLPYSTMEKNRQREVCSIDFKETARFGDVSTAGKFTVLNNYSQFAHSGMDVDLVSGTNGLAIRFDSKDEDSYAILEITKYLRERSFLSILGQEIKIYLAEELDAETFRFTKSFCAKIITEIKEENNVYSAEITPYQREGRRLYLVFKGNGIIDDLIIKEKETSKDIHKKNINKIGFSVSNAPKKDFIHKLYFTNNNNINGLDISKENDISCGSTVDWDLTQIYKLSEDKNIQMFGIQKRFDIYNPVGKGAYLLTAPIFISNKLSVKDVVIKINELSEAPFKDFSVTLYTFNSSSDTPKQLGKQTADNIFIFKNYTLGSYLQIKVDMEEGTKIHDMDILLKYREDENNPLIINERTDGYFITQVYDTGYSNTTYSIDSIDFEYIEGSEFVQVEVRGCREGEFDSVWTEWANVVINEKGEVGQSPVFENCHLFQFKITLLNPLAKIKINSFNLKVVA